MRDERKIRKALIGFVRGSGWPWENCTRMEGKKQSKNPAFIRLTGEVLFP